MRLTFRYAAIVIAFFGGLAPAGTHACSCIPDVQMAEIVADAPVIFTGRVIAVEFSGESSFVDWSKGEYAHTTFEVIIPWKGLQRSTVVIHTETSGPSCGVTFTERQSYTVLAFVGDNGQLSTSSCLAAFVWINSAETAAALHDLQPKFLNRGVSAASRSDLEVMRADAAFYASARNADEALGLYAAILAIDPRDTATLEDRAMLQFASGEYSGGLSDLDALLAIEPDNRNAIRQRNVSLLNLGQFELLTAGGADLSNMTLFNVNAPEAILNGADFRSSLLDLGSFNGAKLAGANFHGATLIGVDLRGADLRNADLRDTRMFDLALDGALLDGATYSAGTLWPRNFDPAASGAVFVTGE